MRADIALLAALACLAASAPGASAQWATSKTTQPEEIIEPNPIKCECSDVNPRDGVYYNVTYTCLQQLVFGSCGEHFIRDAVKELPEGYCQVTCGRCDCCKTVADVLKGVGALSLLEAAKAAGLDRQLAAPASMFTLLAPTDEAFAAAPVALGVADLRAANPETVQALLQYHIIPPHSKIDAVWTSPFLAASAGAPIPTALPGASLAFRKDGASLTITGALNSAKVVTPDVEACKSFINVIDAVLLPPADVKPGSLPDNAGNIGAFFGPTPSVTQQAAAATATPPASLGA